MDLNYPQGGGKLGFEEKVKESATMIQAKPEPSGPKPVEGAEPPGSSKVLAGITSPLRLAWRRFKRNRLALAGGVILIIYVLVAAIAPAPYDPAAQEVLQRLKGPSPEHLLGTDRFGRDLLSRLIYGGRLSLIISISSVFIALLVGASIGAVAGWVGKVWDNILMRLMDALIAFPPLLLAIAFTAVLSKEGTTFQRTLGLICSIAIVAVPVFARVTRGAVLRESHKEYVEAARAIGMPSSQILIKHVLRNVLGVLIVQGGVFTGVAILTEASLSFLGLGLAGSVPTWGGMLLDAQADFQDYPYLLLAPGIVVSLAVLSLALLTDGLRDALDPRAMD